VELVVNKQCLLVMVYEYWSLVFVQQWRRWLFPTMSPSLPWWKPNCWKKKQLESETWNW
jgi:hypothetical protein